MKIDYEAFSFFEACKNIRDWQNTGILHMHAKLRDIAHIIREKYHNAFSFGEALSQAERLVNRDALDFVSESSGILKTLKMIAELEKNQNLYSGETVLINIDICRKAEELLKKYGE